ncbi:hypothetical protein [Microvirga mediterraneensis]|nr:hypothetical protein [Microvirga mediterraneensis]
MKLTICIKIALAFALMGSAAAMSFPGAEGTVVARAGDPSQWG